MGPLVKIFLDPDSRKCLTGIFGKRIKFDEPMCDHTSFHTGGPADAFVLPESIEELTNLVSWCTDRELPYFIIGGGTNLLVRDKGIRGVVISLKDCLNLILVQGREGDKVFVKAMAGARLGSLCAFAVTRGFADMNFALGIPGTIGGSIVMNAGTLAGSIADVIDSVEIMFSDGVTKVFKKERIKFDYRKLLLKGEKGHYSLQHGIILGGHFKLCIRDSGKLKKDAKTILLNRKKSQPIFYPSAGCFFRNPLSGKTAGELVDMSGLKGVVRGGAQVSEKHANFIVNRNNASASDILQLAEYVREKVLQRFNVDLKPEVKIIGE